MAWINVAAITAGGSALSSGLNYLTNKSGNQAQTDLANKAMHIKQDYAYKLDNQNFPNLAANYDQNAPSPNGMFNQDFSSKYNPNDYFGTAPINQYYDTATQNLNRNIGGQVANAQSTGAAQAAARGINNASGYAQKVGQQTRLGFAPQFGALEQGRAGALMANQGNLFNALQGQEHYQQQNSADQNKNLYAALMAHFNGGQQAKQNDFQNRFNIYNMASGG